MDIAHRLDHPIRSTEAWQDALRFLQRHAGTGTLGLFTDGDGDGTCSAAQLVLALGVPVAVHVNGLGFGPTGEGLAELLDAGCTGIALLDSGTGIAPEILAACGGRAELCIIDHHPPAGGPLPEGTLVLNPHLHGGEAGESLRNATLCLLLALDLLGDRLGPSAPRTQLARRILATAAIGGYTDCMLGDESEIHDALRATEPDGTHALYARRSLYADSPGLAALAALNALELRTDAHAEYLAGAELSAMTDTLGIGKWDAECPDPSLPYRVLVAGSADAPRLAAELARLGTGLRSAMEGARAAALARQETLANGFLFASLGEGDLPVRYRGNAGRVARALCDASGPEGERSPALVDLPAGDGRLKISWRFEAASDPATAFLMDRWVRELPPGLVAGGGHRYAGGFQASADRLDEIRGSLASLPWTGRKDA